MLDIHRDNPGKQTSNLLSLPLFSLCGVCVGVCMCAHRVMVRDGYQVSFVVILHFVFEVEALTESGAL